MAEARPGSGHPAGAVKSAGAAGWRGGDGSKTIIHEKMEKEKRENGEF